MKSSGHYYAYVILLEESQLDGLTVNGDIEEKRLEQVDGIIKHQGDYT